MSRRAQIHLPAAPGAMATTLAIAAGINLHQPAVLHAGLACIPVTHGLITAADVERPATGNGDGDGDGA